MRDTFQHARAWNASGRQPLLAFLLIIVVAVLSACGQVTKTELEPNVPGEPELTDIRTWDWQAIGYEEGLTSSVATSNDNIVVTGSGTDIWGTKDEFYFVSTPLNGDGSMSVRVHDFEAVHEWSKAGIMLRESFEPDARNVLIHISGSNGSVLQARETQGGATINSAGSDPSMPVGGWVRLTRSGNTVIGELSETGADWRELGRYEVGFDSEAYIGLAVTAHSEGSLATATFSDLALNSGTVSVPQKPSDPGNQDPTPAPTPPAAPSIPGYDLPAATLYVDGRNGNDSNSGRSEADALRTVGRATSVVRPGDVVYIRGGTYPIDVRFRTSGTASQPIVWASYPGERAVFDGSDQSRGRSEHKIRVDGVSFNHFVNFEVRNGPTQGIFVRDASDNLFYGIETHGHNGSGIQNYSGNRNRYEYVITHNNYDSVNGGDGNHADGIGISAGDGNVIRYVVSYNNSDDGIDAWRSTNTLIEYSIAFDNGRGSNGNGNGFKLGGNSEANYTVARFNIAFDNRASGFHYNTGRYITLDNNTAFNNDGRDFVMGRYDTVRNNLSVGGRVDLASGATARNNSWDLGIDDAGVVSTDRRNPQFLALRSDSAAIDAGVDVGQSYTGSAPDLGALQFTHTIADIADMGLISSVSLAGISLGN